MGASVPSGVSQNVLQSSESASLKAYEPNLVLSQYPISLTLCQWFYSPCLVRLLNGFCGLTLTLFGQRIRNAEVILVEVQQLHRSVQRVASLVDLVGRGVHGDLRRTRRRLSRHPARGRANHGRRGPHNTGDTRARSTPPIQRVVKHSKRNAMGIGNASFRSYPAEPRCPEKAPTISTPITSELFSW